MGLLVLREKSGCKGELCVPPTPDVLDVYRCVFSTHRELVVSYYYMFMSIASPQASHSLTVGSNTIGQSAPSGLMFCDVNSALNW